MFFPFSLTTFVILITICTYTVVGLENFLQPSQIFCSIINAAKGVTFEFPPYKCTGECPDFVDGKVQMRFNCKTSSFELLPYFGRKL